MQLPNRHLAVVLLTGLLLCLTAVSVHGATHASGDLQSCELCSGHANPAHAIPVAAPVLPPPARLIVVCTATPSALVTLPEVAHLPRGPPSIAQL